MHALYPALLEPHVTPTGIPGEKLDIDGGAHMAAANTFIKVCNVLDGLLDDEARWSKGKIDELETALKGVYDEQAKMAQEHREALIIMRKPSSVIRPSIVQLNSGVWVASAGVERNALRGVGLTPDEAVHNFNVAYFTRAQVVVDEQKPVAKKKL
jgi:hypothetical protein